MVFYPCYYFYMFKSFKINNKTVFYSDLISGVTHFFTTRESFIRTNEVSLISKTLENKKDICDFLEIDEVNLISPNQVHGDFIQVAREYETIYADTDAMILANYEQALYLNFADCTPVIFYDRSKNISAIAHAGWRGTANSIAVKTVKRMIVEFSSDCKNISAVIGPAICEKCYQVSEDVVLQLKSTLKNPDGLFSNRNGEYYVDLKGINARQLQEFGVMDVDICPYCTSCDNDLFFSYRKENATTNRHSAVLKLR